MTLWPASEATDEPPGRRRALPYHARRAALAAVLAIVTYLLFPASPAVEFPLLEVGAVAPENVIAPFAFTVRKSDSDLQKERDDLARSVPPMYRFVPAALDSARADLGAFDRVVAAASDGATTEQARAPDIQAAVQQTRRLLLSEAEAAYLASPRQRTSMTSAVRTVYDRWLAQGVAAPGDVEEVRGNVLLRRGDEERSVPADSVATFPSLVSRARLVHPDVSSPVADALYLKLIGAFFHPTIVFDRPATERMRQELRRAVDVNKYTVRAGEKIIGAHEVIGREDYEKLRGLREQMQGVPGGLQAVMRAAGAILINLLVLSLLGAMMALFRPQLYASMRQVLLVSLVYVTVLGAAAIIAKQSDGLLVELIPIALAAVMFSVLFDPRFSLVAAMVLAYLVGGQNVFRGTNALFLCLIGGVAAAFSVRVIRRRNQAYYSIATITIAYGLAVLALGLTLGRSWQEMSWSFVLCALNAIVSVSLAMILLPPAEELTGIDTYLKLLEWSDLNRPLMQRLSLEAPGTYAHTIAMANLVESAANAVGANGLLARVGTYYHDIGKLKKPQYFVENQSKGRNPHDKLKPGTSAAIIRNHIRDGLELAEEYKLPMAVRAFITEHHGTGSIAYFLDKARERDGATPVNSQEFAYPGPIPQSAETAICMLADGVEASMRVLNEPTPDKIREVVDHMVRQRIDQGQLAAAPLTLHQLEMVKAEFVRVLSGMYHNRIDYPTSSGGVTSEFAAV
ncbi:MAG TPA: HDIG domain-containing protein [Gemmatimonadaceae bacterium]|jgi:hypothetical protein|nr:HDIG domain-containing protein [Gemmatimonadaceae bacterium]